MELESEVGGSILDTAISFAIFISVLWVLRKCRDVERSAGKIR